jgi:surface antigen|nr:hypothetical protein [Neorhizobium tomejilense]
MRLLVASLAIISVGSLSACATTSAPDQAVTGSVARNGGPVQAAASLFIGDAASRMDDEAKEDYLAAQSFALDSGSKTDFKNESVGAQGNVSVGPSTLASHYPSMECRSYAAVVWVLGNGKLVEGDACREEGGAWQAMGYVAR